MHKAWPRMTGAPISGVVPAATLPQGHPAEPCAGAELLPRPELQAWTPGHSYTGAPLPVGWQQCSTQGLWGHGVGRPEVGWGQPLKNRHTHPSLFLILTYISPRVQKPLSYVMLHSVALNPKPKVPDTPPESHMQTSLTHTQSPSHSRVSLMVFLTHSLTQSLSSASPSFHTGSGEGRPSGVPQACLMLPSPSFPRMP